MKNNKPPRIADLLILVFFTTIAILLFNTSDGSLCAIASILTLALIPFYYDFIDEVQDYFTK